jgi:hypothetical protein
MACGTNRAVMDVSEANRKRCAEGASLFQQEYNMQISFKRISLVDPFQNHSTCETTITVVLKMLHFANRASTGSASAGPPGPLHDGMGIAG